MEEQAFQKIVFTGPESTGKTTLAQEAAANWHSPWVPEYARTFLEQLSREYQYEDLERIARGQVAWEQTYGLEADDFLMCDTGLLVLRVWSEIRFEKCCNFILEYLEKKPYAAFILCGTDIPWEYDPLREHPHHRDQLYQFYLQHLKTMQVPFLEVRGSVSARLEQVEAFLATLPTGSLVC